MKIMFVLVALKLRDKAQILEMPVSAKSRKENFPDRLASRNGSSSLLEFSARGINPIKLVYDPDRPDGRLNLTASTYNQLGQYTSIQSWSQGLLLRTTRRFLPLRCP